MDKLPTIKQVNIHRANGKGSLVKDCPEYLEFELTDGTTLNQTCSGYERQERDRIGTLIKGYLGLKVGYAAYYIRELQAFMVSRHVEPTCSIAINLYPSPLEAVTACHDEEKASYEQRLKDIELALLQYKGTQS